MGKIAISYEKAMEIASEYAKRVHNELDAHAEVFLYGSIVRNEHGPQSDIDIAVVSKVFTNDVCHNYARVNLLAYEVHDSIDAQAIIYEDWIDQTPFTFAVKQQGVQINQCKIGKECRIRFCFVRYATRRTCHHNQF